MEAFNLEGRIIQARAAVRQVLAARGIALTLDDNERIEGCEDLSTLNCWTEQALLAHTAEEALR